MPGPSWPPERRVEEIASFDAQVFAAEGPQLYRPLVVRGLAAEWPLVAAGREGARAAADYLRQFDTGAPAKVMRARPEMGGRFFYAPDMRGYNFAVSENALAPLMDELLASAGAPDAPAIYAGSSPTAEHLPGFSDANAMPLATPGGAARIWIGNRSRVSAHYDVSDNIAVVALGRRRFILFPPEQTPNLYVGPLDVTIAGQPVSMVDLRHPDLAAFPRFAAAMKSAVIADLGPGDAIYVPTLWWHAVEALDDVNILVNYWYNHPPFSSPFAAMLHAVLAVRELPEHERAAWRVWFETYVFGADAGERADHLPLHARGVLGPPIPGRNEAIRHYVMRALNPR